MRTTRAAPTAQKLSGGVALSMIMLMFAVSSSFPVTRGLMNSKLFPRRGALLPPAPPPANRMRRRMTTTADGTVWKEQEVASAFLNNVRGAIPLAQLQLETILRIVRHFLVKDASQRQLASTFQKNDVARSRGNENNKALTWLDLGCGDGILGRTLQHAFPQSRGVLADFSQPMLDAARELVVGDEEIDIAQIDYSQTGTWMKDLPYSEFDVIVSGFSIHHQPDDKKRILYQEVYNLLKPGGVFLNLEHVQSPDETIEALFYESLIDSLYDYHAAAQGNLKSRQELLDADRADAAANILAPVESQCEWLREIGYCHVDCYLKHFEIALFGGVKPE